MYLTIPKIVAADSKIRFLCTKKNNIKNKNQSFKTYSCSELLGLSFQENITSLTHRTGLKNALEVPCAVLLLRAKP
jgi:hypothetical protein